MTPIVPTLERFADLATQYNSIPVLATLICDDMTPLSAFARLQSDSQRAFLLESVVGGESVARYSFLGADPARTCQVTREHVRLTDHASGAVQEQTTGDPLGGLGGLVREYHAQAWPGLPRFLAGAVGYAS